MTIRWISYTSQNIPGNQIFDLDFHSSLKEAVEAFRKYRDAVGTDECHMTLYAAVDTAMYSRSEMIAHAKDFAEVGCPFDYPDRLITTGIGGGVKIEEA